MRMHFDLAGRAALATSSADEVAARYVRSQMDPFPPATSDQRDADVVIEERDHRPRFTDIHNPAGDGIVTASDGSGLSILHGGRSCQVPDPLAEGPARFVHEPGFPLWRIFGDLVRPALQLRLPPRGAVAVHSATVEVDGRGVMVAGWSESGKTETALALVEDGARFLSDKWTVLGPDSTLSAFPVGVGIRRWVLPYLPRLRSSLPPSSRAQLAAAGAARIVSRPLRKGRGPSRLAALAGQAAERTLALADRAALTPSELRRSYGQDGDDPARRVPLSLLVLLTTVPGPEIEAHPADPEWAAARLARSALVERRRFFAVRDRARFAAPLSPGPAPEEIAAREEEVLRGLLAGAAVIGVRAPFPVDPRRVAAAVARWV